MDNRVLESGASATPPAAPSTPSVGYPTKGNPSTGTPASKGGVFWHYQIGEEIRAVIVAAGLVPSSSDLTQLAQAINKPHIASVVYFATNTAPTGWLKANGALVSRTTYANLFSAIGTIFGVGDGATTFALPDLRGEFLRGWDDGRGVDTGRVFGGWQPPDVQLHDHGIPVYSANANGNQPQGTNNTGLITSATRTTATGGTETRPRNVALLACIKY